MNRTQAKSDHAALLLRQTTNNILLYFILLCVASVTVFPFLWVLFTSFKGPTDAIYSVPPQLIPHEPTLDNYFRVWNLLPIWRFFLNSIIVTLSVVVLNTLFTSSGFTMPFSVTMPVMKRAGVTSKAGLAARAPLGEMRTRRTPSDTQCTSASSRSSMGMSAPVRHSKSIVELGAAT